MESENRLKSRKKVEFGDFQTPYELADSICRLLEKKGIKPACVVEPTCGLGSFLSASIKRFSEAERFIGFDINPLHVEMAIHSLAQSFQGFNWEVRRQDFFKADWGSFFSNVPEPVLVIGNPPWVTNSELGGFGSSNIPIKKNFKNHGGLDAITGNGNFDISEWMLIHILEVLNNRYGTMAMLCKTSVARRVLAHVWENEFSLRHSAVYSIDALKHFGVSVDACLLLCEIQNGFRSRECDIFSGIEAVAPQGSIGFRKGGIIKNVKIYDNYNYLDNHDDIFKWRSGIKHDCAKIMELKKENNIYVNGFGEAVDIEEDFIFPMLKSSDIANDNAHSPRRFMIVTQKSVNEDTSSIKHVAPKTWLYLQKHSHLIQKRTSRIYAGRPPFSIFGVGEYSFAPFKVAISGLYKRIKFTVIRPFQKKPVVLDDTCYFLSFESEEMAENIEFLLNSDISREFLDSMIFWDAKRPITLQVLRRLNICALAEKLGMSEMVSPLQSLKAAQIELW